MVDNNNKLIFYVKWLGYSDDENTWVKQSDFNTKDIINDYMKEKNL